MQSYSNDSTTSTYTRASDQLANFCTDSPPHRATLVPTSWQQLSSVSWLRPDANVPRPSESTTDLIASGLEADINIDKVTENNKMCMHISSPTSTNAVASDGDDDVPVRICKKCNLWGSCILHFERACRPCGSCAHSCFWCLSECAGVCEKADDDPSAEGDVWSQVCGRPPEHLL
jgi:hypothetical protein